METLHLAGNDLLTDLTGPTEPSAAGRLVIIDQPPTEASDEVLARAHERLATLPCVLVGTAPSTLVDLVVTVDDLAEVEATFALAPTAGSALALHLRAADRRPPLDALVAESALFSALQAGPEHGAWRAGHQRRDRQDMHPPVRAERDGTQLRITLDRPNVRNAVSSSMRDVLLAALAVAEAVPELEVHLHGAGPDFCAGGDLDEFGTTPDPATAHLIRTRRSLAAVLHRLAPRTTTHLHGGALGAGIELAAFAGRVLADPETRIGLPELGLGLIPGAGGTVSLPLRIGRQRTAWLALTRRTIDAPTALAWGLVDEIVPVGPSRAG